jgi:hypothetical protein
MVSSEKTGLLIFKYVNGKEKQKDIHYCFFFMKSEECSETIESKVRMSHCEFLKRKNTLQVAPLETHITCQLHLHCLLINQYLLISLKVF